MEIAERPRVDRKARFQIPPQKIVKQDPILRRCEWNEVVIGFEDPQAAITEATRCIQCPAAPCIKACPVQNDIPGALWELEHGNFIEAADIFRLTSTMPEICGRICPQERLCEGSCVVGNAKRVPPTPPVAIGRLEAFVADYQRQTQGFPNVQLPPPTGRRVAVVGAGPAGLAVAELVVREGHGAVVFEAWPKPGGILLYGIPNFKLDKRITEEKVGFLEGLGVEFLCNVRIGTDITVDQLFEQGFDAVYLGHGAGIAATMGVSGDDLANIYIATDFLVRGNLTPEELPEGHKEPSRVGEKTVVIGGGDTAMDCVRTAVRLTYQHERPGTVTCLYRRTESEMPGREEERLHAKEEGVNFEFLTAPIRFIGDTQGNVRAVECVTMALQEPDASGRARPVPVPGSEHIVEADTVVLAVGYGGDEALAESAGVEHRRGLIGIDPETGMTDRPGVFAGGDNVGGTDLMVTALAQAYQAAQGIMRYLA